MKLLTAVKTNTFYLIRMGKNLNLLCSYGVYHGFRLKNQDDDFQVKFDHFLIDCHF